MPWGDGTGPAGQGPMTGRGRGYCAGFDGPGCTDARPGRGRRGRGARNMYGVTGVPGRARFGGGPFGGGRFVPRDYVPTPAPLAPRADDETEALKAQAEYLADALQEVRARLDALAKG